MADLAITISNTVLVFGPTPTTKWDVAIWDNWLWDIGIDDLVCDIYKLISNAVSISSSQAKDATRTVTNEVSVSSDLTDGYLQDSATGYYYVFISDTISHRDRDEPTVYTSVNDQDATWSTTSTTSTTWS